MAATYKRLRGLIPDLRPDVIHAHSPVLNGIPAMRAGRAFGVPVVYEMRALWEDAAVHHGVTRPQSIRYRLSRAAETHVLQHVDHVITISQGLKGEILSRGVPSDKISVVPNAVDLSVHSEQRPGNKELSLRFGLAGKTVLGFIGSFYAYEGLDLLLRALVWIVERSLPVKLLLVGGGPEELRLKRLTRELRLEPFVAFAGRIHHDQVGRYYDLVDVFVYPRISSPLTELVTPLKPLEAMAQRKIVVASNVGGHLELIRNGETGLIFEAGDVRALAARIEEAVLCRNDWPRIAANGRQFVERERSWTICVRNYCTAYSSLRQ